MNLQEILTTYEELVIIYLLVANLSYMIILLIGFKNARKLYIEQQSGLSNSMSPVKSLPAISILVPSYNESSSIVHSIKSLLRLNYPEFEVVVCLDGCSDNSLELLIEAFDLQEFDNSAPNILVTKKVKGHYFSRSHKNLCVFEKENGGKADALNAAINFSRYDLICCVDADSIVDPDGLIRIATPFIINPDDMIATGGTIMLVNPSQKLTAYSGGQNDPEVQGTWLGMIQSVEYLRAFLVGRMGWDYLNCNVIISGAFGLFEKDTVIRVGGYSPDVIGEDMELVLRMFSYKAKNGEKSTIKFLPDPICWTEPPQDLSSLSKQRIRWQQGLCQSLWRHKQILFKPWSGKLGFIALPYFWLFEAISAPLEILGYLVTITGLYFGFLTWFHGAAFFIVSVIFGMVLSMGAVITEQLTFEKYQRPGDITKLFLGVFLEQMGFRQLHLLWRLKGITRAIRGVHVWGHIKRKGFKST